MLGIVWCVECSCGGLWIGRVVKRSWSSLFCSLLFKKIIIDKWIGFGRPLRMAGSFVLAFFIDIFLHNCRVRVLSYTKRWQRSMRLLFV